MPTIDRGRAGGRGAVCSATRIDVGAIVHRQTSARRGEELGLIGPLEARTAVDAAHLNCVLVAPLLRPGVVGDVGSGAGLPGLVLAIARPDVEFVLIEPMERRVEWLREESARLGLANVDGGAGARRGGPTGSDAWTR